MPRSFVVAAVALALTAALPSNAAEGSPQRRIKVAVMEIRALGADAHLADLLSEVALTEVGAMDRVEAVGKSDIESILGFEKQKKMFGCTEEASCLAEIGGALGVEYVVVGSLGRIGSLYRLDMKLVETSKGRVRARTGESVEGREEKLVASMQRSVHRLLDPILGTTAPGLLPPPPVAAPVPPPPRPEEREAAPAPAPTSPRRTWAWVAGSVGLAALGGGVVSGLAASSAFDKEKVAAAAGDLANYQSYRDQAKSRAMIADVLYGVGAAGVGVGAWLYFTSPSASAPPVALGFSPTPAGALVVLTGGF